MEFLYSEIKKFDVVSVTDGKNLGKVCDMAFYFPEGRIKGFFVTGCKGFKWGKSEEFIPVSNIVKIGEDVILVRSGEDKPPKGERPPAPPHGKPNCPPPCPPMPPQSHCPPQPPYPPQPRFDPRRNFDDYE